MKQKILIVDDEVAICDLLKINLEAEGYEVFVSYDGENALRKVETLEPDLLILDIMLPKINGFDVCRKVTSIRPIPIIMLTAKSDLVDKVLGLELGADDYVTKPFHARELTARVKALLRRMSRDSGVLSESRHLINGPLEINTESRRVTLSSYELELSVKEYELLCFLTSHIEQVFTRDAILERVWGYDFAGDTRTVDVHIQRLRKKLKDDKNGNGFIHTVFGVGYKMTRQ